MPDTSLAPMLILVYVSDENYPRGLRLWNIYPPTPLEQISEDCSDLLAEPSPFCCPVEENSIAHLAALRHFRCRTVRQAVEFAADTGWLPETWCDPEGTVAVPSYLVDRANSALCDAGVPESVVYRGGPSLVGYESACRAWLAAHPDVE